MKKKGRTFGIAAVAVAVAIGGGLTLGHAMGYRLNFTPSAPKGLWHVDAGAHGVERGELVEICPPERPIVTYMGENGYLAAGDCADTEVVALLKPIAALPGDVVAIKAGEPVRVNGRALPHTQVSQGMPPWPDGDYTVEDGQVWVFSTFADDSFDSRYFGPVSMANIRGVAAPVAVKGDAADMTLVATEGES